MSSALQSATTLQQNDYVARMLTLTHERSISQPYPYHNNLNVPTSTLSVLTFSNEVEYVWNKPWTRVSMLFILVRYCGLVTFIMNMLLGSSFIPGPAKVFSIRYQWRTSILKCVPIDVSNNQSDCWMDICSLCWCGRFHNDPPCMGNVQSIEANPRYSPLIVLPGEQFQCHHYCLASDPTNVSVASIPILDVGFCMVQPIPLIWMKVAAILGIANGAVMCIFVIVQFVRQSLQMYRVTKQWQLSQYMSLLVRQGILYFVALFLVSFVIALDASGKLSTLGSSWQQDVLIILEHVPMITLTTRFIMSIRELHAHDVQGRRGEGIDTGFGLPSSGRGSAIVLADVEQNEGLEDVEEIPMG
ncbi:hypothetical protein OG21DRAFT_1497349, partial [Imleria badia]